MSVEKLKSDIEKMITNAGLDLASVAATLLVGPTIPLMAVEPPIDGKAQERFVILRSILTATMLSTVFLPVASAAQQYPTIVGRWYSAPDEGGSYKDCDTHWGWDIAPMSLGNAMVQCRFNDVARDGWEVTWRGRCSFEGQDIPGDTVVATETNGELDIVFGDGSSVNDLRRCQ